MNGTLAKDELREISDTLEDHEKRLKALEDRSRSEPKHPAKELSIKEFMLQKLPESDVNKTLLVGYFLENRRGMSSYNVDDLGNAFREAKEPTPANINLCVIKNIGKGYMMEAKEKKDDKKAWTLTSTGERLVENGLKAE